MPFTDAECQKKYCAKLKEKYSSEDLNKRKPDRHKIKQTKNLEEIRSNDTKRKRNIVRLSGNSSESRLCLGNSVIEKVKEFFERDDHSGMSSGKINTVTIKNNRKVLLS